MGRRSLAIGALATLFAGLVLVAPLNSRFDTVKPCGQQLDCSVLRYKSLALSLAGLDAPFNGLNRTTVPILSVIAVGVGVAAGRGAERRRRDRDRHREDAPDAN